jgi:hypothetical protein
MYRVNRLSRQQQATANALEMMALADGHHPAVAAQNRQKPIIPGPRAIKNMLERMPAGTTGATTEAAAPVAAAATASTTNAGDNADTTAAADANAPTTTTNDEAIPMANLEMMPPLPPIPPPINNAHVHALQDEWMMPRHETYEYAPRPFFQYVHRHDAPYPNGTTFSKGQFLQIQPGYVRNYLAYKANYDFANGDHPCHTHS